jgi:hypothetical protein|tara:strand:- start:646 stop:846 length:201 start_codon:yes stop_codon:yes gene_type:complete
MANFNEATLEHPKFQQNTPAGRSWRKRYTKENGGEWANDGTWSWSGGAVSKPKPSYATRVVKKEVD